MIWSLVGISIIALFTATVATALTWHSENMSDSPEILGTQVGVKSGSIERHIVILEGGIPVGMSNFDLHP